MARLVPVRPTSSQSLRPTLPFSPEPINDAVAQGRPGCLDDVIAGANRAPAQVVEPVRGLNEYRNLGVRPRRAVDDPHAVVIQPDLINLGVKLLEGSSKRVVQGIHGSHALANRQMLLATDADLYRRLRERAAGGAMLDGHAVADQVEELGEPPHVL